MKGETILKQSSDLAIIASARFVEALQADPARGWLGDANFIAVESNEPVPVDQLGFCSIAVVEVDPAEPSSLDRIKLIRRHDPEISIVVAMESTDLGTARTLLHSGVSDVVALPLAAEEILQACVAITEVRKAREPASTRNGDVICAIRALGGGGATTMLTHLAAELAERDDGDATVCIIDLDIQFGSAADYLGITAKRTLSDLLEAGERLDEAILQSVIIEDDRGFSVIAAPRELGPVETVGKGSLDRIISLARKQFDYVLIDLPRDLTNWSLGLISQADRIVMLAEQNVSSLRQARRRIDLFRSLGMDIRLLTLVLNKAEKGLFKTIRISDVEKALGVSVAHTLSLDEPHVSTAQEQGLLVWELRRKSAYQHDVSELADMLVAGLANEKSA